MKVKAELDAEIKKIGEHSDYYVNMTISVIKEEYTNKLKMNFSYQTPGKGSVLGEFHSVELLIDINELQKVIDFFKFSS